LVTAREGSDIPGAACSVAGSPETVRKGMRSMIERTNADELMIVSDIFDPEKRRRSFEIIAGVNS
jgi:alkanesulfonate monooxygenase SsuD/methylene tetrahydromethanopterin reductase-like flavin-dependent oxidoreductase (luciferase family)